MRYKIIYTLFVIAVSFLLHANAQDTLNAVKVFELDTIGIDGLGSMRIDTVGSSDGNAVFCFYSKIDSTTKKQLRTDIEGNVIDVTDAPLYTVYTVYNGDTLYISIYGDVINATSGDTIAHVGVPIGFAASSSRLFVFHHYGGRTVPYFVDDILNHNRIWSFNNQGYLNLSGFCYGDGKIYALVPLDGGMGKLTYMNEDGSNRKQFIIPVLNASGIGVYRGSLYVYSKTTQAVYRIEPSDKTRVYSVFETGTSSEPVHYGLDGRMIDSSVPGIHILRYPDGRVNKIVVR